MTTVGDGLVLAIGVCLYLATGMLYGLVFQLVLTRIGASMSLVGRLVLASVLSLAIWLINFYAILSWLQPLLFGGRWIVENDYLPWWVAAATHLVFGWTMLAVSRLGQYTPYRPQREQA